MNAGGGSYFVRMLSLVLMLPLLQSCASVFAVVVKGDCISTVAFSFHRLLVVRGELEPSSSPLQVRLNAFRVDERDDKDVWVTVWKLDGSATADSVVYGRSPPGMQVGVEARSLRKGGLYQVSATGVGIAGYAYAGAEFRVEENGCVAAPSAPPP